jgi:hypothetical protein
MQVREKHKDKQADAFNAKKLGIHLWNTAYTSILPTKQFTKLTSKHLTSKHQCL